MLTVYTPGKYFFPEYTYIAKTVFEHFLHQPLTVVAGDSVERWRIVSDSVELCLPNLFFPEDAPETYFDKERISYSATSVRDEALLDAPFPALLTASSDGAGNMDILGQIFFLISCFEEYLDRPRDIWGDLLQHGSWVGANDLLDRPLVDELLTLLVRLLEKQGIHIPLHKPPYSFHYSCDMDWPCLWNVASLQLVLRTCIGSLVWRRNFAECFNVLQSRINPRRDAFWTFDWIMDQLEVHGVQGSFYAMGGSSHPEYDAPAVVGKAWFAELLHSISRRGHEVGFHPSYETATSYALFEKECSALREVCPSACSGGRQHYLRFMGGSTWQMWNKCGFIYDSSVGFNKAAGFRCGTAREFPVFDVEQRTQLPLLERPLLVMEGALLFAENLAHDRVFERIKQVADKVRNYGGNMTLLWHNSQLVAPETKALFSEVINELS